jgi:hypothetical protein
VFLTSLIVQSDSSGHLKLDWSASNPLHIYVLNSTQYDDLLLHAASHGQIPTYIENFTGMPASYISQYDLQTGPVSLALSQGQYYLFTGSTNNAILDSLSYTLQQNQITGNNSSPFEYLLPAVPVALGILMVAVGVLILTRRFWR